MNGKLFFLFIFLIATYFVSASCDSGQIDINSASATELDKLEGVGETIAKNIIDARPFDSVDDLIDVERIGPITLDKIKTQDLACVDDENEDSNDDEDSNDNNDDSEDEDDDSDDKNEKHFIAAEFVPENKTNNFSYTQNKIEKEIITLSPQSIKTEDNIQKESKKNYPVIGLVSFCLVLGVLFLFKEKSRRRKNEFKG